MAWVTRHKLPVICGNLYAFDKLMMSFGATKIEEHDYNWHPQTNASELASCGWEMQTLLGSMTARAFGHDKGVFSVLCKFSDWDKAEELHLISADRFGWYHEFNPSVSVEHACRALKERFTSLLPRTE